MATESLAYREVDNMTITEEDRRLIFYYRNSMLVFRKALMFAAEGSYLATKKQRGTPPAT